MRAPHAGEVLQEDYLKPLGLSVNALAKVLDVPTFRMKWLRSFLVQKESLGERALAWGWLAKCLS